MVRWHGGGLALVVACVLGCFSETLSSDASTSSGTSESSSGGEASSEIEASSSSSSSTTTTSTSTSTSTSASTFASSSSGEGEVSTTTEESCSVTRCETCENCIECRTCALEAVCDDENLGCDEDCQALVACMDTCDARTPSCYTNCCCAHTLVWQSYNVLASCLEGECLFCGTPSCVTKEC